MIDARDGFAGQLRGWGRYARCLVTALGALPRGDPYPLELAVLTGGGRGPEVVFEQLRLPLLLRRRAASLVHATDSFLPLVRPCPGVVTIHDLAFEELRDDVSPRTRFKYRTLTSPAARSAQRIICPSSFTRDQVCSRYGVDPGKVRVIPEAPALPVGHTGSWGASRAGDHREGPYILAVGDLRQKKNLAVLVSAYAQLWQEGARDHSLVLAGLDAGQGPRLRKLAGTAPLALTGYVSDERLDELIRGADLLVHPSPYEGFGLVLTEAMVRGTPVLAARAGALPETAGEAAAYFDAGDSGSLAERLGALLSDTGARARLSAVGRTWVERFSWERTARETLAVYRELL